MRVSQSDVDGSHGVALLAACGGDEGMGKTRGVSLAARFPPMSSARLMQPRFRSGALLRHSWRYPSMMPPECWALKCM